MSLKSKIVNAITSHPKLVTFGIGLAITFVVAAVVPQLHHPAFAARDPIDPF